MAYSTSASLYQFSGTSTLQGEKGDQGLQGIPGLPGSALTGVAGFPNNTALKAFRLFPMPTRVRRDGFYVAGDGGLAEYVYSATLDAGKVVDNGAVVQAADGGFWIMDPQVIAPDVRQWGAGTLVPDSAAFIQAALDAAVSPRLQFSGSFVLSKPVVNNKCLFLDGGEMRRTTLIGSDPTKGLLTFPGYGGGMRGMGFGYLGTPTSGACLLITGFEGVYSEFIINSCSIGIECTGVGNQFRSFFVNNYATSGIYTHNSNDNFFTQFILNAGNRTNGALGGIRLYDKNEANCFSQGDVIMGVYGLTSDAASNSPNVRPAYCNFTDVFFDSTAKGNLLSVAVVFDFTQCWWACGRADGTTDSGQPGLILGATEAITFTSNRFFGCGGQGCFVGSAAKRTSFLHCTVESNSQTTGPGVSVGIEFQAGCTDFSVIGGSGGNNLFNGGQSYTVGVQPGASDRYVIQGVLCGGRNKSGNVFDGGTGTNKLVQGNF